MKIAVIGAGNIGLVVALTFSKFGHDVIAIDSDPNKILQLQEGKTFFYEPGLDNLLGQMISNKKITFTNVYDQAALQAEIYFICVGTPSLSDGASDLSQLYSALNQLRNITSSKNKLVVLKSTVPPGTTDLLSREYTEFKFAFNPEFVREGSALSDFQMPDRIVVGSERAEDVEKLKVIYEGFLSDQSRFLVMSPSSAEISKYASNAFLAARVTLINEFSRIAEKFNANIDAVSMAVGLDNRIGPNYLKSGIGYGGSCLPKDISSIIRFSHKESLNTSFFEAIQNSNELQFQHFYKKIVSYFEHHPTVQKKIAIWGVSFKPLTDDIRFSPAMKIISNLQSVGFQVCIHDPKSLGRVKKELKANFNETIRFFDNAYEALQDANALIILTDWPEYQSADFGLVKTKLKNKIIFDARNIFDPKRMAELQIHYASIGRPI